MANKSKGYTREFSYTRPIMYQGEAYPSADSVVTDEYGNKINGRIFADADGQYYTKDRNNNIFPVMPVENLDEINVTVPRNIDMLADAFSRSLVMGNDKTQVRNLPHREYNTQLKANAERGAREHALWDKEHPNLSAWRDAATAVPFAVAATPFVGGTGSTLLNTGIGQTARYGLSALMGNPYVAGINDALGLGFAGKGAYDVSQGKFTPMTAMDLAGGVGLMYRGLTTLDNTLRARMTARRLASTEPTITGVEDIDLGLTPTRVENVEPVIDNQALEDMESVFASIRQSTPISRAERTVQGNQSVLDRVRADENAREIFNNARQEQNVSSRLSSDSDIDAIVQPTEVQNTYSMPWGTHHPEDAIPDDFGPAPFESGNPLDELISNEELQRGAASYNPSTRISFKSRDTKAGEAPYTEEEINALIDENGELRRGVKFDDADEVYTGAHGEMFMPLFHPEQDETWVLKQHLANTDPNNPFNGKYELKKIMEDNPGGRSGILVKTHFGDTSMDSTPLAYVLATRFAKRFKPLNGRLERTTSNSYGYNTAFKQGKDTNALNARAKAIFDANPDYKAKLLRDENGNMTAYELTDENGTFQIPLNSRQEVLDIMNAKLHQFNKHYGTSYGDILPQRNLSGTYYDESNPYPWSFGESFDLPNIYGIAYKQGGKIKRRLLTQL